MLFFFGVILAGILLNAIHFQVFFNIDFIFGSTAAFFALQVFNLRTSVLAAALIASYTYFLWNHPYAIVIMTLEVAIAGWLHRRYLLNLLIADVLYWFCLGMPLVYLLYGLIMQADESVFLTMIKQAMNGILNVLIARLALTACVLIRRCQTSFISYRETMSNALAFFVLVPALILLAVDSRLDYAKAENDTREDLRRSSRHFSAHAQQWLINRKISLTNITQIAASSSNHEIHYLLTNLPRIDSNFSSVVVRNSQGRQILSDNFSAKPSPQSPETGENRAPNPLPQPEALFTATTPPTPQLSLIVPLALSNSEKGYLETTVNLLTLRPILESGLSPSHTYILLDTKGRVIFSNHPGLNPSSVFAREKGTIATTENGLLQWTPLANSNSPMSERWKKSLYIEETYLDNLPGWKLIIEEPVGRIMRDLFDEYSQKFSLLFLVLLIALAFAEFFSSKMVETLENLCAVTSDFVHKIASQAHGNLLPRASSIKEVRELTQNFNTMANELSAQFEATRQQTLLLEQQVAQQAGSLQISQNLFQSLTTFAPIGIFLSDAQGNIHFANDKWCELTGLSLKQAWGTEWISSLHPEDQNEVSQFWNNRIQDQQDFFTLEYRILTPGKKTVWLYSVAKRIEYPTPKNTSYIGCVVDISERKQYSFALQESLLNFRCLFETINDLILVASPEGSLLFVNKAFRDKLLYSAEEVSFLRLDSFFSPEKLKEIHRLCLTEAPPIQTAQDFVLQTKNYQLLPVEGRFWLGSWNGDNCIFCFLKDLTEEREAHYRFERLFHNNPALLALVSFPDLKFVDINASTMRTLGYRKEEMIGRTSRDIQLFVLEEQRDRVYNAMLSEGSITDFEILCRGRDGRTIQGLLSGERIITHTKEFYLFVMIDITGRKQAEKELEEAKDRALAADASKTQLLLTVAHEFRTPLTLLTSSLDILDRYAHRLTQKDKKHQETHIRNACQQLNSLVSSVLTYNQIETKDHPIRRKSIDIGALGLQIAEEMQVALAKNHIFTLSVHPDLGFMLMDEVLFRRITENLLSNAFQYTPPGKEISLSLHRTQDTLVLRVADQGIGISEGDQTHIFESFYRGTNVEGRRGVGLGLGIVKDAVDKLGGTISLQSAIDKGTVFHIQFPWLNT